MTDDELRSLRQAQDAAIEFGNDNYRLRVQNKALKRALAQWRAELDDPPAFVALGVCPLCGATVFGYDRRPIPHSADCPFVLYPPEADDV